MALVGLTVLFLAKDLPSFSNFVINRGFGVSVVSLIAFYELLPLAARTLPFAVLIGALVGLGRLRVDHEIIALAAAGISGRRLVGPVCAFTTVMMTVGLILNLFAAPWATRSLYMTLRRMAAENPGLSLRPGTVQDFSGIKLVAREISARGDQLRGVLLWIPARGQTLFAERGEIIPESGTGIQLVLHDGVMLRTPQVRGEDTRFESFFQPLRSELERVRKNEDFLTGVSFAELTALAWSPVREQDLRQRARMEFHRRFSYPVASVCFGLLAVPLALVGRRFSRAAGGVAGLLVTVVYYGLMQLGDGLIQAGVVRTSIGVWLPNGVMLILALVLLWRDTLWRQRNTSAQPSQATARRSLSSSFSLPDWSWWQGHVLQRYVAGQYLSLLALSFALLLTGYLLVDILERLQWFARYHADALKALQFYVFRLPFLLSHIVPMSLLLATALTVGALSAQRELIGMRACGVSVVRALLPTLLIAGLVAPVYFLLNEVVVPKTNASAEEFKNRVIKNRPEENSPLSQMIWYHAGSRVYQAAQLDPRLGLAKELSIYNLGPDGLPVERIDALEARHIGNGVWELTDPIRIEISAQGFHEAPADTRIQLGEAPGEPVDTLQFGVRDLRRQIRETEAGGYDATIYRVDFHVKLAAPVACVLLPAIALFFAVNGPPFPGPAVILLVSVVLGIGHILLTGVCASLGYGGFLPPGLAGWTPSLGWTVLAGVLARRSSG